MPFVDKSIYLCVHCGDHTKGKYCKNCGKKDGREKIDQEQIEVMKENIAKGFTYDDPYWKRLKEKGKIKV